MDGTVVEIHPSGLNAAVEMTSPRCSTLQEDCNFQFAVSSIRVSAKAQGEWKKTMTPRSEIIRDLLIQLRSVTNRNLFIEETFIKANVLVATNHDHIHNEACSCEFCILPQRTAQSGVQ